MINFILRFGIWGALIYLGVAAGVYLSLRKFDPSGLDDEDAKRIYGLEALLMPASAVGVVVGALYAVARIAAEQAISWIRRKVF